MSEFFVAPSRAGNSRFRSDCIVLVHDSDSVKTPVDGLFRVVWCCSPVCSEEETAEGDKIEKKPKFYDGGEKLGQANASQTGAAILDLARSREGYVTSEAALPDLTRETGNRMINTN